MREVERYVQLWYTGSTLTIPNRDGCGAIALGNADTAGAVIVTPRMAQASSVRPFILSAGAPFIGELVGPLDVTPITGTEYLTAALALDPIGSVLDIVAYPTAPSVFPGRAVMQIDGGTTGLGNQKYVRVRGRKRVIANITTVAAASTQIIAYVVSGNGLFEIDRATVAAATSLTWQPTESVRGNGTTLGGFTVIDYIGLQTTGTADRSMVAAWDY